MCAELTKAEILKALYAVEHPEIATTLVDLGMIHDVEYKSDSKEASLTLALPILGIPVEVREYLINSLEKAVSPLGVKLTISVREMKPEERQLFMTKARTFWRG